MRIILKKTSDQIDTDNRSFVEEYEGLARTKTSVELIRCTQFGEGRLDPIDQQVGRTSRPGY